jgi:alkylation response protein AidB-like acyl-CoA dehydrogenase
MKPAAAELVERARRIGALARERATETERNRCVSAELIGSMREAGLFRILQPEVFGGFEYGYDVFVDCVTAVAAGDGSTGWVYSLGAVHPWMFAGLPLQTQHEIWDGNRDAIAAVSYAPTGTSEPVEGGYRLTGRWSFASGCDNADWAIVSAPIAKPDGGKVPGFFFLPRSDVAIEDDWFTMGLAGTGSKSFVIDGAFVPQHRVEAIPALLVGNPPGAAAHPNPLYRQPFLAVVPTCLVAPAIGMARGALDVFVAQVKGRVTRGAVAGGNNNMANFPTVQMRVAEAAGCIDAAELLVHRDLKETEALAAQGGDVLDLRLRNRRNHAFATRLAVQAVDVLFAAAGGSGLGLHHPLQRFWRDIHAAAAHISLNWDVVAAMYGQHVFGLEPKGQY